jgi:outer membrane protein assembly factor BamD
MSIAAAWSWDKKLSLTNILYGYNHRLAAILVLFVALGVSGCQAVGFGSSDKVDTYVERQVDDLYNEAADSLAAREFESAATQFEEVERQHPYSKWAQRALLMSAYAYYEKEDYESAISAAERYMALHPSSDAAPYAQYLVANSYYEQIGDVRRDQEITRQALRELEDLVRRYPNTDYARDSKLKVELTRDHLAGKEMDVGRYYLKDRAFVAAINRFRVVVTDFQTTAHVEEALARLAEAYMALGVASEAQTAAAILGHNYPSSSWYENTYILLKSSGLAPRVDSKSWISRAWKQIAPA